MLMSSRIVRSNWLLLIRTLLVHASHQRAIWNRKTGLRQGNGCLLVLKVTKKSKEQKSPGQACQSGLMVIHTLKDLEQENSTNGKELRSSPGNSIFQSQKVSTTLNIGLTQKIVATSSAGI